MVDIKEHPTVLMLEQAEKDLFRLEHSLVSDYSVSNYLKYEYLLTIQTAQQSINKIKKAVIEKLTKELN